MIHQHAERNSYTKTIFELFLLSTFKNYVESLVPSVLCTVGSYYVSKFRFQLITTT